MNLETIIDKQYDLLNANDKEMITTILKDKNLVKEMNSTQISEHLHVSRTTFTRLLKKLDIDTYAEFKLLLLREIEDQKQLTFNIQEIAENYHRMIDGLKQYDYKKICQIIYDAGTIYLYGTGNEQKAIAEEFKRIFLILGKYCVDLFDLGEVEFAKKRFLRNDLMVVISLSGETRESLQIIKTIKDTGIHTLSITRWENNSLARLCQNNLYVGTKTVSQNERHSYEMVAAFYIILDILSVRYLEYRRRRRRDGENED